MALRPCPWVSILKSPVRLSVFLVTVSLSACEIGTINLGGDPVGPDDPGGRDSWSCAEVTEIPMAECEVLTALYHSTDGNNWINSTGWLETNTPCNSWFGVLCLGQVVRVVLASNGLAGSIPPDLGGLTNLNVLDLRNNQLTGTIPPELGNLSNLTLLHLRGNQLTGTIPPELGNLHILVILNLARNQLTGTIPLEFGNLSNLTRLFLGGNQLTGTIPPELGNLLQLDFLHLPENQLEGLVPFPVAELGGRLQTTGLNQCRFELNTGLFMPDSQDYIDADLDSDGFICGVPFGENTISLVTIAPPDGTTLSAGQVVSLTATVSYELNGADSGEIKMVIQAQTSIQSGPAPIVEIGRGSGMVTLSDQVTIPATGVTTIYVNFSLKLTGQTFYDIMSSASYPVQPGS